VPSVRSRDVGCAEWPRIRRFEHFLYLLDFVNNAFNVHASQSSSTKCEWVKRKRDWSFLSHSCIASQAQRPQLEPAALANGHRVPCGHEQYTPTMLDPDCPDRSARSDVLLREEPDEEEDDEEEEGNFTDDVGDDDEEDDGGYSVRVCRLCQW